MDQQLQDTKAPVPDTGFPDGSYAPFSLGLGVNEYIIFVFQEENITTVRPVKHQAAADRDPECIFELQDGVLGVAVSTRQPLRAGKRLTCLHKSGFWLWGAVMSCSCSSLLSVLPTGCLPCSQGPSHHLKLPLWPQLQQGGLQWLGYRGKPFPERFTSLQVAPNSGTRAFGSELVSQGAGAEGGMEAPSWRPVGSVTWGPGCP